MNEPHHAGGRLVEAGDAIEDGGLARAVGADQCSDVAALCRERQIVDSDNAAKTHREVIDGENVIAGRVRGHPWPSLTMADEISVGFSR